MKMYPSGNGGTGSRTNQTSMSTFPGPASPAVLSLRGVSKAFGAVQALREVSVDCRARRDPRPRRGERVREVDIARDRQRVPRSRRGLRRGGRDGRPLRGCLPPRAAARSRHGVSDVLARLAPVGSREPLPCRTAEPPTDVRRDGVVGGRPAGRSSISTSRRRRPQGRSRWPSASCSRSSRRAPGAEGVAPRRADDRARARGRRPTARAGSRAEPAGVGIVYVSHRLPKCSGSPTGSAFSATACVQGRSTPPRCRRRASSP